MKVLFDIIHPAHINFFSNLVKKLKANDIEVDLIVLDRGKIVDILRKEYGGRTYQVIGRYSKSLPGLVFMTGLVRLLSLMRKLSGKDYDVCLGVAAFQMGLVSKIKRRKVLLVYDDPGHTWNFRLSRLTADKFFLPRFCGVSGRNIHPFNCLKEWAYLSPKYFTPKKNVLLKYRLQPYQYIFIREVETKSLNYRRQKESIIKKLYSGYHFEIPVLLSLENKLNKPFYKDWTVLEEPIEDIHSLMYYSRLLISNGDSMAREASLLGVESIYCGIREMGVNNELIGRGLLSHIGDVNALKRKISGIICELLTEGIEYRQRAVREKLLKEWDDINDILYNEIIKGAGK